MTGELDISRKFNLILKNFMDFTIPIQLGTWDLTIMEYIIIGNKIWVYKLKKSTVIEIEGKNKPKWSDIRQKLII